MLSALCHEFANPGTAEALLSRLTRERQLHRYVASMAQLHSLPNIMAQQHDDSVSFCRLFDRSVCPEDLLLLARADAMASGIGQNYAPMEASLQGMLAHYREIMALPFVQGADLVAAGFAPGSDFHQALAYAHELRLAGVEKEDSLRQTSAYLMKLRGIVS